MTLAPVAWVVGSGGLLGSAVCRVLASRGVTVHTTKISWSDTDQAIEDLRDASVAYAALAGDQPWRVYWCAGTGTTTSTRAEMERELAVLRGALGHIGESYGATASSELAFFLASSAGAIYAGTEAPPFTESSVARPLSEYGRAKLTAEAACEEFATASRAILFIGRIANLYGPGQNLSKSQGLISVLVKAVLTGEPVRLYVPTETTRDYIYSRDCAEMAVKGLERTADLFGGGRRIAMKILASGQAITLKELLFRVESVLRVAVPLQQVSSSDSAGQSLDLRFESTVMTDLSSNVVTSLDEGIATTYQSIREMMRQK